MVDNNLNKQKHYKVIREGLDKNKPSIKMKHVKNIVKVNNAINDLENNHNHSWYTEIINRISDDMNRETIYYRGTSITGTQMKDYSDKFALSLQSLGLKKGDEIIACFSNIPELIYLMLGASKIGVKLNFIGESFDKEFIKNIFTNSSKKMFICTDDKYDKIKEIVNEFDFSNKILISLADSLKDGTDPYIELDKDFYDFSNKVNYFKQEDNSLLSLSEFLNVGLNSKYNHNVEDVYIDDEFTITYTSGSTKIGWPKAIVHSNKSYISIGRFHDPDLSRMPAMRKMRGLAHIPTHSNTDLVSSISDTLMQKCSVACEPIYNQNFFARSLLINKPGFAPATRSFWLTAMKQFDTYKEFENVSLPFAVNYVIVGEENSKNESLYIDRILKKLKAGSKKMPKPLSPITISVGGGDCEHGGLFFTLFKGLREQLSLSKMSREDYGLIPFQLSEIAVLKEDGTECDFNEIGCLVANSPCTMKYYKDDIEATKKFIISDAYGRQWGNCNVWAYIDKSGNVHMKGRKENSFKLSNGDCIPNFMIASAILEDKENIMSCEVVKYKNSDDDIYLIAHIELYPGCEKSYEEVLNSAEIRCKQKFNEELVSKLIYKIRTGINSFPLTKSGKRSVLMLELENIDSNVVKPVECDGNIELLSFEKYIEYRNEKSNQKRLTK